MDRAFCRGPLLAHRVKVDPPSPRARRTRQRIRAESPAASASATTPHRPYAEEQESHDKHHNSRNRHGTEDTSGIFATGRRTRPYSTRRYASLRGPPPPPQACAAFRPPRGCGDDHVTHAACVVANAALKMQEAAEEEKAKTANATVATETEHSGLVTGKVHDKSAAPGIYYTLAQTSPPLAAAFSEMEQREEDVDDMPGAEGDSGGNSKVRNGGGSDVESPSEGDTSHLHVSQVPPEGQEGGFLTGPNHKASALAEDKTTGGDCAVVIAAESVALLEIADQLEEAAPRADGGFLDCCAAVSV
ncbi:hypothetical protein GH5_06670 [Leishmania sp. Ghana 2012 LV757]|uniref:hypothetical protein n=1 Tax=Leishmania sp. Ghana 2012 LV757 TaxID=2803181 RepID=UPI001B5971CF|nr:hypothetical protein GH5_06670 [Leishmania sp. Ghana 2012 LV757]